MAGLGTLRLDAKSFALGHTMNVTVRRGREWRWRLWIVKILIRLACWIAWINCEIVEEEEEQVL